MSPRETAIDEPAVRGRGVTYRYGGRDDGRLACDRIDFAVRGGSVHAFLGPNGSGKSTLFKVLATIYALQDGSVSMLGMDLATEVAALRRVIGVVFQSPAVDKKLTVRQNLVYGGQLYGLSGAELAARVDEMLAHTALRDRARDRVADLSGGLRRRVEIAKCLLHRPRLVLLDEPSTGLDPGARGDLWRMLRSIDGLTVLFTTHLMDEAEDADHVTILSEGEVVADGEPAALCAELGEAVLELGSADPDALAARITGERGIEARSIGGAVRIERDDAHRLVADLVDTYGDAIERVTVSHPSLEDVYIRRTGHRFWSAAEAGT